MNIWIISDGEPLPTDEGPVRLRRMGMLSEILADKGCEVHWFSSTFHHYKKEQRSNKDIIINVKENLFIHLIKTNGYKKNISLERILHYKKMSQKFESMSLNLTKPDIILATMAPLELSESAVRYGEKNQIPTVVDIRDLWPEIYKEVLPKKYSFIMNPYIYYSKNKLKKTLKKSTSMIGVTEKFLDYGKEIIKENMIGRKYDRVFHTAYKPKDIYAYKEKFKDNWSHFNLSPDDFIVTFIGNFGRQFDLEPLINVAKEMKCFSNIKFVFCGVGETLEFYKEDAKEYPNMVFPGWIDENMILSLMSVSKIGVAPYKNSKNFRDNTPNKFGEYLSASLPVMVSVEGVMQDLLDEYDCGYYYSSSEDLLFKINNLYNDSDKLQEMSSNASKLYNENFNANIVYNQFAEHLISLSNKKK